MFIMHCTRIYYFASRQMLVVNVYHLLLLFIYILCIIVNTDAKPTDDRFKTPRERMTEWQRAFDDWDRLPELPTIPPFNLSAITLPVWQDIPVDNNAFIQSLYTVLTLIIIVVIILCGRKYFLRLLYSWFRGCCRTCHNSNVLPVTVDNPFEFSIFIAVGNQHQHCFVHVINVPFRVQDYDFNVDDFIRQVDIHGRLSPKLSIDWRKLTLTNKYTHTAYTLPPHIALSIRQARSLRKMLNSDYYIVLYTKEAAGNFDILPLYRTAWAPAP